MKGRPREPNSDECKDILEDIRRHHVHTKIAQHLAGGPHKGPGAYAIYNPEALGVLTAWLRHKCYWETRSCDYCGAAIENRADAVKYCSDSHRSMAYQQRRTKKRKTEKSEKEKR